MKSDNANYQLTNKEHLVLQLLADGNDCESICNQLMMDDATLQIHLQHLFAKFSVKTVSEAVVMGVREKIVTCQFISPED